MLRGNTWSSYERQGEMGLLLTEVKIEPADDDQLNYGKVMWFSDSDISLVKLSHIEPIDEN